MADIEAAAWAPPRAPPPPTPSPRSAVAAEIKAAVADAVIYCFVGVMFICSASGISLIVARYAGGGNGNSYVHAAAAFASDVFPRAFLAEMLLCPFTMLLLLWRLDRRRPEPPEELVVVGGVYATVQLHGPEHPGARGGGRQGAGYGLVAMLIFVAFSTCMLLGLLLRERLPAKGSRVLQTLRVAVTIGDIGGFVCSVMVICVIVPYMLIQLRSMPR